MFCALHDQFASLGRHAQLTRCLNRRETGCFSAVAELLVVANNMNLNEVRPIVQNQVAQRLTSGIVNFIRLFAGVSWTGGIKYEWGG